jgi:hypothetical protein
VGNIAAFDPPSRRDQRCPSMTLRTCAAGDDGVLSDDVFHHGIPGPVMELAAS